MGPSSDVTLSSAEMGAGLARSESGVPRTTTLPPLQDLDMAVIESLPPDVVSEINDMYGGKLLGFISENKSRSAASTTSSEGLFGTRLSYGFAN